MRGNYDRTGWSWGSWGVKLRTSRRVACTGAGWGGKARHRVQGTGKPHTDARARTHITCAQGMRTRTCTRSKYTLARAHTHVQTQHAAQGKPSTAPGKHARTHTQARFQGTRHTRTSWCARRVPTAAVEHGRAAGVHLRQEGRRGPHRSRRLYVRRGGTAAATATAAAAATAAATGGGSRWHLARAEGVATSACSPNK